MNLIKTPVECVSVATIDACDLLDVADAACAPGSEAVAASGQIARQHKSRDKACTYEDGSQLPGPQPRHSCCTDV